MGVGLIARFVVFFSLISSIFDFITISSLIYLLHARANKLMTKKKREKERRKRQEKRLKK